MAQPCPNFPEDLNLRCQTQYAEFYENLDVEPVDWDGLSVKGYWRQRQRNKTEDTKETTYE